MAAARRLPTRICWGSLENDRTFRTSNSYVGKYTIEGDITRYDIDVAQVPNMVGQGHSHARIEGDELRLTSKRMQNGRQEGHTKFVWNRMGS